MASSSVELEPIGSGPPLTAKRALTMKIAVLARHIRKQFDEHVEQLGVTRAKWVLIATVANNPGATQREIAAKLQVTDVTAGRLIDRVCADGLLERHEHPQDRRAYCVSLTPAAQPVLHEMGRAADRCEDILFDSLSDDDLETLNRLLGIVSQNLVTSRRDAGERKVDEGKAEKRGPRPTEQVANAA